ncbi:putative hydrolase of the HAD superfamily [Malonomonas rubra DSM 5091]|uniref:Putative hydrolase of the HAD superfamily n=1 Tax=Malonomonas rubra DSM 5091 TaxID=1122189 RepID=A0A1M6FGG9_MALRU|nr:pyrimidine 5'-nucleotidase [Malonomonas rubra]SHI96757.1 putative hydrolase of the HAD superfamily [Malonomonas rubra DSM 5091]
MKAVLFDLDNTLYPAEKDLFSLIDVRINHYMQTQVGIKLQDVDGLRRKYWKDYGTTLQGLIRHHEVDPEDYLSYVHEVDVGSRLSADDELRCSIEALPVPSYVFTNGSRCHVDRVVAALGLDGVFADIFDIRIANYQPKPNPDPYLQVLGKIGLSGAECVMVEDQPQNLQTAKELGMKTVLVGEYCKNDYSYVDAKLARPAQLGALLNSWSR